MWPGATSRHGYSHAVLKRQSRKPFRMLYEHFVGTVPPGTILNHLCHDDDAECRGGITCQHRRCVNPAHLLPVPMVSNTQSGAATRGWCRAGLHQWTDDNTIVITSPSGRVQRRCRACKNLKSAAQKAASRAAAGARTRPTTTCHYGHPRDQFQKRTANGHAYCSECHRVNSQAAWRAKNGPPKPPRTHCDDGHPMDSDHGYRLANGSWRCRPCAARQARERRQRA